jgi:Pyruvate/2-oxoacid:ferredoxin oxidoreductase gamma subunit
MIGLLSRHLDVPVDAWLKVIREILPQKLHEVNEAAFELGRLSA